MLDRIATEILEQILKHACTDGGHTGNALAAVSRYVRGVSAPVRYHSVALCGARQIRAFLRLLDDIGRPTPPPELGTLQRWKRRLRVGAGRPPLSARVVHIRHLFLADCARDRSTYNYSSDLMWTQWEDKAQAKRIEKLIIGYRGDVSVPKMRKHDRHWVVTSELEQAAVSNAEAAITDLLRRLAPSLQHLCYDQALQSWALFQVSLPALEELTCCVTHRWTHEFHDSAVESNERVSFLLKLPALKHLHVVLKGMEWTTCFPRELPPSLQRVRFSDSTDPGRLVYELAERKNSPWLTQDCLRTIIVSRNYDDYSYPPNIWEHQSILAQMIEYAQGDSLHKIGTVEELEDYDLHRLRVEWLARVQGGEGCWKEGTPLALMKS
jgi:hypothetical protein